MNLNHDLKLLTYFGFGKYYQYLIYRYIDIGWNGYTNIIIYYLLVINVTKY